MWGIMFMANLLTECYVKSEDLGTVFVDKNVEPLSGCGVWEIVHLELDQDGQPYAVARPIMAIEDFDFLSLCMEAESDRWNESILRESLKDNYPDFD